MRDIGYDCTALKKKKMHYLKEYKNEISHLARYLSHFDFWPASYRKMSHKEISEILPLHSGIIVVLSNK